MKKEADVTLSEEVERNWQEITSRDYQFSRNEKTISLLENCKKENVVEYIASIISSAQKRKKLSCQVLGNPDGIKIQSEVDENDDAPEETGESVSCDLDPDSVFEMEYINCGDTSSSHFIMDSRSFKKGLRTYDITHITK